MSKKDVLYVVMPAYNEEDNIRDVVKSWYAVLEDKNEASRLVVADSGSTDGTHAILKEMKKEYPKLKILKKSAKQHGPKVLALYKVAIKMNADYVFQTDSDGQTNPDEFEEFWTMRSEYDGIFGLRNERGDGKDRAFVERVVCMLLRLFFGVKIPDANAPFRLMKVDVLKKYINRMKSDYNLPNIMITTYYAYYNQKYKFIPISFSSRRSGKNSINIPKIIKIGLNSLGDFWAFRRAME
ncbi:MAG TPA: glycosyltransferase [Lachnospiraceae bacterium]|nr:glycosyltransferase [Lachnospiraceae bacterium]